MEQKIQELKEMVYVYKKRVKYLEEKVEKLEFENLMLRVDIKKRELDMLLLEEKLIKSNKGELKWQEQKENY